MPEPLKHLTARLTSLLEEAANAVRADYAALGILDPQRQELEQFVAVGVDQATREVIGHEPRGRGVLGLLIEDPKPLRLHDVTTHERSYGFPPGHPEMHSFLGVPVLIGTQVWGNLYFTQTQAGSFSQADETLAHSYATRMAGLIEDAGAGS